MDWTALADGFVAVMQALSGAMLVAGAAIGIREGCAERGDFDDYRSSPGGAISPIRLLPQARE